MKRKPLRGCPSVWKGHVVNYAFLLFGALVEVGGFFYISKLNEYIPSKM